jgi:hypothetical protein
MPRALHVDHGACHLCGLTCPCSACTERECDTYGLAFSASCPARTELTDRPFQRPGDSLDLVKLHRLGAPLGPVAAEAGA